MFLIVVGDVDVEKTIDLIEESINQYDVKSDSKIVKYMEEEPREIAQKEIVQKMDIYLPGLCIGYKLDLCDGKEVLKNECIADIISDMYFSRLSDFFAEEYNKGYINDSIDFIYEGSETFSHIIISTTSTNINELEKDILSYINKIKFEPIDEELFEIVKRKKIGENILSSDSLGISYRRIIDSILNNVSIYYDVETYNSITSKDIKEFLNKLDENYRVSSKIISK